MSMSTYPPPGGPSVGWRFEEALKAIELELQHAIAYMNDAVVPEIRRESITALRAMSDRLRNLADKFERSGAGIGGQSPGKPEDSRR
jgi:hypothetical protein